MFSGRETLYLQGRQINHLQAGSKKGYWAASLCSSFRPGSWNLQPQLGALMRRIRLGGRSVKAASSGLRERRGMVTERGKVIHPSPGSAAPRQDAPKRDTHPNGSPPSTDSRILFTSNDPWAGEQMIFWYHAIADFGERTRYFWNRDRDELIYEILIPLLSKQVVHPLRPDY
jgi:hypothetical protein